jgi:hypothetical protein
MADMAMAEPDPSVLFGGLLVLGYYTAQHDGRPAFGFKLADKMGAREVGRVVLLDTEDWYEERPEWQVIYDSEQEALENFEIFSAKREMPRISKIVLDYNTEDETVDEALAEVAARFGVTGRVVNPSGPGGGHPEIEFTGLTDKLEKFLLSSEPYGYGFSDEDMKEFFYKS